MKIKRILLFFTFGLSFLINSGAVYAIDATSKCVTTKVGNPTGPVPQCGNDGGTAATGSLAGVVSWAEKIASALEPGTASSFYCYLDKDISNGSYSASKRACLDNGVSPTGRYWCTDLVIDAFNLAGITNVPKDEAVFNMINDWQTAGGGLKYFDFTDSSTHSTVLPQIQAGFAMMFDPDVSQFNNREHVTIVRSINIDKHGQGEIHTDEADSEMPVDRVYPVDNYEIQGYDPSIPVAGFGGVDSTVVVPPTNTAKPVIVLDPGHSGQDIQDVDPRTKLLDHDYPNTPEIQEVFEIAQMVKNKLQADGYTVIMTKKTAQGSVSLRGRADIATNAQANLAVSIHDDHSQSWSNFAQIYVQQVGLYRTNSDGQKVTFTNQGVAQKSQTYGQIFAEQRSADEGRAATVTAISFDGRAGIAPGNIPEVELFAPVPWVYNEVGADGASTPLNENEMNRYAQGLIDSIEKSVPLK